MKTTILFLALLASTIVYGKGTSTTSVESESNKMNRGQLSSNSNDRYDNLDIRTNSKSTPASIDNENRQLDASTYDQRQWQNNNRTDTVSETTTSESRPVYRSNEQPNLSGSSTGAAAGSATADSAPSTNTDMKAGDTYNKNRTAQNSASNAETTELVRKIRSEITSDQNLSMSAHNIKIIGENNQIFLKGPVKNTAEKAKVEEITKRMAGGKAVINQTYIER